MNCYTVVDGATHLGIALTRDERELWVADGVANRLHVFDATAYPPVPSRTIALTAQPRWVAFSGCPPTVKVRSTRTSIRAYIGPRSAFTRDKSYTPRRPAADASSSKGV